MKVWILTIIGISTIAVSAHAYDEFDFAKFIKSRAYATKKQQLFEEAKTSIAENILTAYGIPSELSLQNMQDAEMTIQEVRFWGVNNITIIYHIEANTKIDRVTNLNLPDYTTCTMNKNADHQIQIACDN